VISLIREGSKLSNVSKTRAGIFRRGARGTIDIIADILSLCESWTRKTGIMYKANLSHQMLKFYLWHLVELGLLEESEDSRFRITERGTEFILYYKKIGHLMSDPHDGHWLHRYLAKQ
jgi:predicted transcriptional regulator